MAESAARIARRRAEADALADQIHFQVQEALERVKESEQAVKLYDDTVLPAAHENLKAAQNAYTTNKIPFSGLLEAQRNLIELRDRYNEIRADWYRRRATLDRAVGGPLVRRRVLRRFVRVGPILNLHVPGRIIETTPEHPFYVASPAEVHVPRRT